MKKVGLLVLFTLVALVLVGCDKGEKYEINQPTTLKGKISINPIRKDGETKYVSILELDKAIYIDGVITDKIEIDYDKSLKNNTETTITGTIRKNEGSTDLKYSIAVDSIDNILSYINKFSNDVFSVAIPAKLMKTTIVKEIKDGFAITVANSENMYKLIALTTDEYKTFSSTEVEFEKVKANKNYVVILIYPDEEEESNPDMKALQKEINNIKSSVKIK